MHFTESPMRKNIHKLITCEGNFTNITCPDSKSIFIIDGFYGRKTREV